MSEKTKLSFEEVASQTVFLRARSRALANLLIKKGLFTLEELSEELKDVIQNDFVEITKDMYDFDLRPFLEELENEDKNEV